MVGMRISKECIVIDILHSGPFLKQDAAGREYMVVIGLKNV